MTFTENNASRTEEIMTAHPKKKQGWCSMSIAVHYICYFSSLHLLFQFTTSAIAVHYICCFSSLHLLFQFTTSAIAVRYICYFSSLHLLLQFTTSAISVHCICYFSSLHLLFQFTTSAISVHYICYCSSLHLLFQFTTSAIAHRQCSKGREREKKELTSIPDTSELNRKWNSRLAFAMHDWSGIWSVHYRSELKGSA